MAKATGTSSTHDYKKRKYKKTTQGNSRNTKRVKGRRK